MHAKERPMLYSTDMVERIRENASIQRQIYSKLKFVVDELHQDLVRQEIKNTLQLKSI